MGRRKSVVDVDAVVAAAVQDAYGKLGERPLPRAWWYTICEALFEARQPARPGSKAAAQQRQGAVDRVVGVVWSYAGAPCPAGASVEAWQRFQQVLAAPGSFEALTEVAGARAVASPYSIGARPAF